MFRRTVVVSVELHTIDDICFNLIFLIYTDNRLFDTNYELQNLNLKLSVENEQLRSGAHSSNSGSGALAATKISQLENKLLTQQEELTALHKRKGENSQMIVDLSLKLDKQNKVLAEKDARLIRLSNIYFFSFDSNSWYFHIYFFSSIAYRSI